MPSHAWLRQPTEQHRGVFQGAVDGDREPRGICAEAVKQRAAGLDAAGNECA